MWEMNIFLVLNPKVGDGRIRCFFLAVVSQVMKKSCVCPMTFRHPLLDRYLPHLPNSWGSFIKLRSSTRSCPTSSIPSLQTTEEQGDGTRPYPRCCNPRWCKDYTCTGDIPKMILAAMRGGRSGSLGSLGRSQCADCLSLVVDSSNYRYDISWYIYTLTQLF